MRYRQLFLPAALAALTAPLAAQGFRYTFEITSREDRTRGTVTWIGDRGRIDIEKESGRPDDGDYVLLRDGGRTLITVHPDRREYATIRDTAFERIVSRALEAVDQVIDIEVLDATVEGQRLGDGEAIGGHATRRYRLTQDFTVRIGVPVVADPRIHQTVVTEYWVADDVTVIRNPLLDLLAGVETALAQHDAAFVRKTRAARAALFTGTPLRIVVRSTSTEEDGDAEAGSATRTIEITEIGRVRVDPATLEVPAGYRVGEDFTWRPRNKRRI